MGIEYHWRFFRAINPAATVFSAGFLIEAGLLLWYAVARPQLVFVAVRSWPGALGLALLLYAFAAYPAIAYLLGQRYPALPTFGLPCPTTIATLGLLVWTEDRPPLILMLVPWGWAVVSSIAAARLGIGEDFGLTVALGMSVWVWLGAQRLDKTRSRLASA
jgi:hypothetical protein